MPTKWLQERANGSKNEHGMTPRRAFGGTRTSHARSIKARNLRDQRGTPHDDAADLQRLIPGNIQLVLRYSTVGRRAAGPGSPGPAVGNSVG